MADVRSGRQRGTGSFDDELAERLDDLHHLRRVLKRIAPISEPPDFAEVLESPQQAPQPMRFGTFREAEVTHQVVPVRRVK